MMHHGMPPTSFIKQHAKYKHGGQPRLGFAGISWMHVRKESMEVTQSENIKWKEQQCKRRSGQERLEGARGHEATKQERVH
jgi:hypothetical protein